MSAILTALDVVSVIILVIMMLILGNTIAMGVRERTTEYGVLRAIGFLPGHIRLFIVGEALTRRRSSPASLGFALAYPLVELGMGRWLEENMGSFFPSFRSRRPPPSSRVVLTLGLGGARLAHPGRSGRPAPGDRRAPEDRMIPIAYNLRNLARPQDDDRRRGARARARRLRLRSALMLSNGIHKAMHQASDPSVAIVLRKGTDAELGSGIEETKIPLIATTPGVDRLPERAAAGGRRARRGRPPRQGRGRRRLRERPDPRRHRRRARVSPAVKIVEGRAATPGTDEVIIGSAIRGRFKGLELGQTFEMRKNRPMKVVGVFDDGGSAYESEVWGDVDRVRATFGRGPIVSSVRVRLESPDKFDGFAAALDANRQLDVAAMREEEFYAKSVARDGDRSSRRWAS